MDEINEKAIHITHLNNTLKTKICHSIATFSNLPVDARSSINCNLYVCIGCLHVLSVFPNYTNYLTIKDYTLRVDFIDRIFSHASCILSAKILHILYWSLWNVKILISV